MEVFKLSDFAGLYLLDVKIASFFQIHFVIYYIVYYISVFLLLLRRENDTWKNTVRVKRFI